VKDKQGRAEERVRRCLIVALAVFVVTGASPAGGSVIREQVVWADLVNVSAIPGALRKVGGCDGCADAGATSSQRITAGDGYVEFSAPETTTVRYVGLSDENAGINPDRIAFAIRLQGGHAEVRERGEYRTDVGFKRGDVFRIAVESGATTYYKNGALLYRSRLAPRFPLVVSASLLGQDSTIVNVVIATAGREESQGGTEPRSP
jgi:hypothetical protein